MADGDTPIPGPVPGVLRRKVLGVPLIYLLGAGVVVLAVLAWRLPQGADPETDTAMQPGEPVTDAAPDMGYEQGPVALVANPVPTTGNAAPDDNIRWGRRATEWLMGQGASVQESQTAISRYLDGESLTWAQGELRDKAVRQFGLPPEPVTPGTVGARPAEPARRAGTPPTVHTVKGPQDNQLYHLAALYYGPNNQANIDLLQSANPSIPQSGPYPVGTRINIPRFTNPRYYTTRGTSDDTAAEIAAKNGTSAWAVQVMNDSLRFPVRPGTRVRVR